MADVETEDLGTGIRPFWSGTISFGLVSVPVALFPANRPRGRVSLRMVTAEGTPLERRYVCSKDEKELDWEEIVRGYEVKKGKFVIVTDDELEAVEPRKSRDIDLRLFVERDEIDPMYFDRAYFLTPTQGSTKAYRLLAQVMEEENQAGIATFVMREKEYLVAILAENGILRAETLRFEDEIRTPEEIGLPKQKKPKPAALAKFEREIKSRSRKVDFSEFMDEYELRLEKLAERKYKKREDVVKAAEPIEEEGAEVIDLAEVLSRSLQQPRAERSGKRATSRETKKKTA